MAMLCIVKVGLTTTISSGKSNITIHRKRSETGIKETPTARCTAKEQFLN